jgi:hypothetical protein
MVGPSWANHPQHRALSIPARPALAVDREPRELGRQQAARGHLDRSPRGCGVGGGTVAVHAALRAPGHRHAEAMQREGTHEDLEDQRR